MYYYLSTSLYKVNTILLSIFILELLSNQRFELLSKIFLHKINGKHFVKSDFVILRMIQFEKNP